MRTLCELPSAMGLWRNIVTSGGDAYLAVAKLPNNILCFSSFISTKKFVR